jgi:hypothetical protein
MSDMPNTENVLVAHVFVAWEIVRAATLSSSSTSEDQDKFLKKVTNAYTKTYKAIGNLEEIK